MTASYGRPGTGKVNALFTPTKADSAKAKSFDGAIARKGPDGRFIDYADPNVAARNAERPYKELQTFLNQALETATPIYKAWEADQVDSELAKVAAQPEMLTAYQKGDADARAWISGFRPQTQHVVNTANADAASSRFEKLLLESTQTDALLKNPYASDEERSARFTQLQGQAYEDSGLSVIPPRYQGEQAGNLIKVQSGAKAQLQVLRSRQQFVDDNSKLSTGFGSNLTRLALTAQGPEAVGDPAGFTKQLTAWAQESVNNLQQSRTPQEIAQILWAGFSNQYNQAVSGGEFADLQTAQQVLGVMKTMVTTDVRMANGQTLGGLILSEGKSLAGAVAEVEAKLQPALLKAQDQQAWENAKPVIEEALLGDSDAARARAQALLPTLFEDPRSMVEAFNLVNKATQLGNAPTEAQLKEYAELEIKINQPGLNYTQKKELVLGSGLTLEQKISLAGQVRESNPVAESVSGAARYNTAELEEATQLIAQAQNDALINGRLAEGTQLEDPKDIARNTLIEAKRRTEKQIKEAADAGTPMSQDDVNAAFRANIDKYTQEQFNLYNTVPEKPMSQGQRMTNQLNLIRQNLLANGGKADVTVFPLATRKAAKEAGKPDTYLGVQRYVLEQLGAATEPDGKGGTQRVFKNPAETWNQMTRQVRQGLGKPDLDGVDAGPSKQVRAAGAVNPLGGFIQEGLGGLFGGGNSKSNSSSGNQSSASQTDWIGSVFNELAGVRASNAGELPPELVAQQNLAQLAKLTSANQSPTLETPTLPQVAANAPATPISLSIRSDSHPIMIAIGLNEGTRTANGGYTRNYYGHRDPGNGARNVGTVSAQQGGSPVQSDRRWAGILSGTMARTAPLVARLGIKPGTVAYNRVMFNLADLKVQSPLAFGGFVRKLPQLARTDLSIETIAKARADSFFSPSGRLDAPGFNNDYRTLFTDQRSRAGTFDYKRRI